MLIGCFIPRGNYNGKHLIDEFETFDLIIVLVTDLIKLNKQKNIYYY